MTLKHLLLGSVAVLVTAGSANAATGWYMSLGAGANWIEKGDYRSYSSGVQTSAGTLTYDRGYIITGSVGYDFGDHWRTEFEVAYRDNNIKSWRSDGGEGNTTSAQVWELSQMVNVLYDVPLGGNWQASVGAGVGGNLVVVKNWESSSPTQQDDYVLAGQLIAEGSYRFSDRWQAYAGYHYMFMDDPNMPYNSDPADSFEISKTEHSLLVGLRFDLQRDGAAPMQPSMPEQPKAAAPKQFIVFFGFNKSNLTPEAQRVVSEAAAAAKETGSASIAVVGHTDTSGSSDYNVKLSVRRSQAVKDALVSLGIAPSGISTSGRGESELMVQTGDGVKEPQNRRATIDLK